MIKLKVDEFNEELVRFNSAINRFKPYNGGFIKNTADMLNYFNSDFVEGYKGLLDSMRDTNAPKLLEKSQNLYDAAKTTVDSIVEVDRVLGKQMLKNK